MEKDRRSGQPYHIRPLESRRVQTGENGDRGQGYGGYLQGKHQKGRHGGGVASKKQGENQQVSGLGKYAQNEEKKHQAGDSGKDRGDHDQKKAAKQKGYIIREPGHYGEKQIPGQQNPGVQAGDDRVIVAVGIFQNLAAEKIHGKFVQDIFGKLLHPFTHRVSP